MSLHPLGDTGYLITLDGAVDTALLARVRALAARLEADRLPGVMDIVPAYSSVAVLYEPEHVRTLHGELPWHAVAEWIERHVAGKGSAPKAKAPKEHVLPVCYGGEHGPDLDAVAKQLKLSADAVVKLHAGAVYTVAAIGFTPGFPYLLGLSPKLAVARRATPRLRVPAGSVGVGGTQTGVYPRETPGGWQLIGRTGFTLFDPRDEPAAALAAGDRVRFKPVEKFTPPRAWSPSAPSARGSAPGRGGFVEVLKPGTLTTVQDLGRRGLAAQGLGVGGALDPWAAMAANLAVGNAPDAAVLECTYVGPILRFSVDTMVAVLGAETGALPAGRPVRVAAGETLDCSSFARGARLYLAVSGGGWRVPSLLGAAATQLTAGFGGLGGRALVAGDRLAYGAPGGDLSTLGWRLASPVPVAPKKETVTVRLVPGPDWAALAGAARDGGPERALEAMRFQISAKSDRMGMRLDGASFNPPADSGSGISRPVVPGTVQIPPDGRPIILLAEGQTIGGYPQLGQVASVDLAKLAQARPGAEIVFRLCSVSVAQQARMQLAADLARLRVGLEMRRT